MVRRFASVLLCGGRGTRMGTRHVHKSCFDVGGKPAIVHLLDRLAEVGVTFNVVVVGHLAESVLRAASSSGHPCGFAYQGEPRGTGDAAARGIELLRKVGYEGDVLVVAGDKYVATRALRKLVDRYRAEGADLAFLVNERTERATAGRVFLDDEGGVHSVEHWDLVVARVWKEVGRMLREESAEVPAAVAGARELARRLARDAPAEKLEALFPQLWGGEVPDDASQLLALAEVNSKVVLGGKAYDPEHVEERAKWLNVSVYLGTVDAFSSALSGLEPSNAQGEIYLTDVVNALSGCSTGRAARVVPVPTDDPRDVMAFNTPEELVAVREHHARVTSPPEDLGALAAPRLAAVTAATWARTLERPPPALLESLANTYGRDRRLLRSKVATFLRLVRSFADRFGEDQEVVLVRAPGRVNLMGRHVDHQGFDVNVVAIDREIHVVASARSDDQFVVVNERGGRPSFREFRVGELFEGVEWNDWMRFVESEEAARMVRDARGDWGNYVKAAVLRLQFREKSRKLEGINALMYGDLPQAAGLSSSSAIVVAFAEATALLNDLDLKTREFIDLCGEGEWFVGTRGGSSDHAAIKCSQPGSVTRMGFFPFRLRGRVALPPEVALVVIDSRVKARKSAEDLRRFNERVLAYEVGKLLLAEKLGPGLASNPPPLLRDYHPAALGTSLRETYSAIKEVPLRLDLSRAAELLPEERVERLRRRFPGVPFDGTIPVRSVLLYGLAEGTRSGQCLKLLGRGDVETFGKWMNASHDGDRVVKFTAPIDDPQRREVHEPDCSDAYLSSLIDDLSSEDPVRVERAQLYNQSGHYACSVPQVDYLVDVALSQQGVFGAQLVGGGLGGCIVALVRRESAARVLATTLEAYERAWNVQTEGFVCQFVDGAGPLELPITRDNQSRERSLRTSW
ncbi:MAG: hypothetical protein Kow0069_21370 [Promethearchaeota archaeon]